MRKCPNAPKFLGYKTIWEVPYPAILVILEELMEEFGKKNK